MSEPQERTTAIFLAFTYEKKNLQKDLGAHRQTSRFIGGQVFPLSAQSMTKEGRGGDGVNSSHPDIFVAPKVRVTFHAGTLF